MLGHDGGERVVGRGGTPGCLRAVELVLYAGRRQREHGDVDAGGVHRLQARRTGVEQLLGHAAPLVGIPADAREDRVLQVAGDEMLLERDLVAQRLTLSPVAVASDRPYSSR